jgi:hypothetical protein
MTSGFHFTALDLSLYLLKNSRSRASRRRNLRRKYNTMAPGILAPEPTFTVKEMNKSAKEKLNFGAVIEDLDLGAISGECKFQVGNADHCKLKGVR